MNPKDNSLHPNAEKTLLKKKTHFDHVSALPMHHADKSTCSWACIGPRVSLQASIWPSGVWIFNKLYQGSRVIGHKGPPKPYLCLARHEHNRPKLSSFPSLLLFLGSLHTGLELAGSAENTMTEVGKESATWPRKTRKGFQDKTLETGTDEQNCITCSEGKKQKGRRLSADIHTAGGKCQNTCKLSILKIFNTCMYVQYILHTYNMQVSF